jgi:hypothetical protein
MTEKPHWWSKARHMRAELGWTYPQIAADLGLSVDTIRRHVRAPRATTTFRTPSKTTVVIIGYVKPDGPKPAWVLEAEKLRAEGMSWDKIGLAVKKAPSSITYWLIGQPIRSDDQRERAAKQTKPKPRPKAGEVSESIMEAARAFARGEIDRKELSYRLRGGAS